MSDDPRAFYDALADDYHLIFADWEASQRRQTDVLAAVIASELGPGPHAILDCACGIGTQALGLAALGHHLHATDLSPIAVARARHEAVKRGLDIAFGVADLLTLPAQVPGVFDVVLAGDNVLPHFLRDADLVTAIANMVAKLRPGGLLLTSLRDYDHLAAARPANEGPRFGGEASQRRISFQVWDWAEDGETYTLHQCIVRRDGDAWHTTHAVTVYRALRRADLDAAMHAASVRELRWLDPAASGFYQPIVLARV